MDKINWMVRAGGVFLLWATAMAVALPAQTFSTIYNFCSKPHCADGFASAGGLVRTSDGKFYGTTADGGGNNGGTVFRITLNGTLTTLYNFCAELNCMDGALPTAALIQGTDGNLYGTTAQGGAHGYGTVFKITPSGRPTTLHSFHGPNTDGANPYAGLIQGANGKFYGTTVSGGAYGYGTVFKITPSGRLTTLHSFDNTDGAFPQAGLVQGTDGNFYGTTLNGGADSSCTLNGFNGCGTVFKITPSGVLTTLHSFDNTDGAFPYAKLVQATDGKFYGTTLEGGADNYGTVFKITSNGTLTSLHSFDGADGAFPYARLVQDTDRNLYGTTSGGGNDGTAFKITLRGLLTTLHSFDYKDGASPYAGLVQGSDENFYGTTEDGGGNGGGTIFRLSMGMK
jgi:uncharacterized repeat protein (TIGR03803 family)